MSVFNIESTVDGLSKANKKSEMNSALLWRFISNETQQMRRSQSSARFSSYFDRRVDLRDAAVVDAFLLSRTRVYAELLCGHTSMAYWHTPVYKSSLSLFDRESARTTHSQHLHIEGIITFIVDNNDIVIANKFLFEFMICSCVGHHCWCMKEYCNADIQTCRALFRSILFVYLDRWNSARHRHTARSCPDC